MTSFSRFKSGFHLPYRFEIVVGSTVVDFVNGGNIVMTNWRPAVPTYKGGGTFQETPLVDGRQLVDKRFENVEEIIDFQINANNVDNAILASRELRQAFEDCADYWTQEWNETIGYIICQNVEETNVRYAAIVKGRMPDDEYPFGQMIKQPNGRSLWDGLSCSIEHLPWQDTIPSVGNAVPIGVEYCYNLIQNGSFEKWSSGSPGNPDNWTDNNSPIVAQNTDLTFVQSGNSSVLIVQSAGDGELYQDIPNMWSGTSTLTVWVYLLSGEATLQLCTHGTFTVLGSDATTLTNQWVQLSATGTHTNTGVRVVLRVDNGSICWDDAELLLCFGNLVTGTLTPTTEPDEVFVVNKQNTAQITHVYLYNGSWSDNQVASTPFLTGTLVNHALYIGAGTTGDNGPFNNLVFNVGTILSSSSSVTAVWEYWNGSAWTALTVKDNTTTFKTLGVNSVHFLPPSNWAAANLNTIGTGGTPPSITGLWIRIRISAVVGTVTPAEQVIRRIYSVLWPYIEIPAGEVGGDIDGLAKIVSRLTSDIGGFSVMTAVMYGLRGVDRGENFTPYLNASDEQNPYGIFVDDLSGSFANSVQAPSGRFHTYTSGGSSGATVSVVAFIIDKTLAPEYFGRYRAFVRCVDVSGSTFPVAVQVQINGITRYQTPFTETTGSAGNAVDVGEVVIAPVSLSPSNTPPITVIVQIKEVAATVFRTYDLVLVPIDEWAQMVEIDVDNDARQLFIDSITYPKQTITSQTVDLVTTNSVVDTKIPKANGPAIIHRKGRQRIWFFSPDTDLLTSNFVVANTVQIDMVKRYLSARGNG